MSKNCSIFEAGKNFTLTGQFITRFCMVMTVSTEKSGIAAQCSLHERGYTRESKEKWTAGILRVKIIWMFVMQ